MSSRPSTSLVNTGEDNFDFLFKIVLIGDCGVGKTCVVQRFKSGTFVERHGNTIGVDFSMKSVIVDGKKVKVSF
jgi:Ras-related protein Rab-43